ncbi:PIN domain-containing protein [Streptomyces sp. NPDC005476]|uniref:PIN domain-containing protein n=1 Tax=Streptomyces sp. NPDC005476 TaxID=3156882 RepID=UPI0034532368
MGRMTNPYLPDTDRGALIVLDTDQLELAGFPDGGVFRMLHTTANLHGHTLAVPQTVAIEHLAHHHFEAQQLTGRSPQDAARRRREALHAFFTILPTPEGAAEEALDRVAERRLPARAASVDGDVGKAEAHGIRDTVVWLTLLAAFEDRNQMLWFLSGNQDFAAGSAFHPDLRAEAEQRLGTDRSLFLGLMKDGIPALLKRWGTRVTVSAQDVNPLVRSESVVQQVRAVITGPARSFAPDFPVPGTGLLAFDGRLGRPLAYQVDDRLWVPSRIRWRARGEEHTCSGSSSIMTRVLLEVSVEPTLVLGVTVLDVSTAEPPATKGRYET